MEKIDYNSFWVHDEIKRVKKNKNDNQISFFVMENNRITNFKRLKNDDGVKHGQINTIITKTK